MKRRFAAALLGLGTIAAVAGHVAAFDATGPTVDGTTTTSSPDIAPTTILGAKGDANTTGPGTGATPTTTVVALATFEGTGNDVVDLGAPLDGAVILEVTYGDGEFDLISVQGLTADLGDTSLYAFSFGSGGGHFLVQSGEDIQYLQVEASGVWTVTLLPVSAARAWDGSTALTGTGDDVVMYTGANGLLTFTVEGGDLAAISIVSYTPDGSDLDEFITSSFGAGEGTAPLPAGPSLLEVSSSDAWTLTLAELG